MNYKQRFATKNKFSRFLIYGESGAGKTHFLTHFFKNALFLDLDNSITGIFAEMKQHEAIKDIKTYVELVKVLKEILTDDDFHFDAVVLDVDHLQNLLAQYICNDSTRQWESMQDKGFDESWKILSEKLQAFLSFLEKLQSKTNIVLQAHSSDRYKTSVDSENKILKACPNLYNSNQVRITDIVLAWTENNFYFHSVAGGELEQRGFKKKYKKFVRDGTITRIIEVAENPYYEAKNRLGLVNPLEFAADFNYSKFYDFIFGDDQSKKFENLDLAKNEAPEDQTPNKIEDSDNQESTQKNDDLPNDNDLFDLPADTLNQNPMNIKKPHKDDDLDQDTFISILEKMSEKQKVWLKFAIHKKWIKPKQELCDIRDNVMIKINENWNKNLADAMKFYKNDKGA